jgi:hypothetical protein
LLPDWPAGTFTENEEISGLANKPPMMQVNFAAAGDTHPERQQAPIDNIDAKFGGGNSL